ncbi:unnamed protein product, partial [Coregonus sp. 'balchen']
SPVIGHSPGVLSVIKEQQVSSSPYVTVRRDGSLHIEHVRLEDGGDYTCLAENVLGSSNRTTTLNIYVMPTIQHGPQVFSTIEGTPISLPCRADGVPTPDITWTKRGELLNVGGLSFSLGSDGSLHITSPTGGESGEFVCTATNAAGYRSKKVQLTVYVRPRQSGASGGAGGDGGALEVSVIEGEDVTLPCEVQSVPPPIITWAKEKQLISPFSPRHTQLPSGSMKILESRVSDNGLYVCVASNIAGNFTQNILLSVLVPPSIQAGPRVMKVQVGHPVDLPCVARGVPQPFLAWLKDGAALVVDGTQYRTSLDGSLTLGQVGLSDQGTYTCLATNIAGSDQANVQLQVQVPPVVDVLEPPFNSPHQERVANQRIAFPCPAKGTPTPVIKWLRNGQELTGNEPGLTIMEDGTLLILASVSQQDNGEYVCTAANEAGTTHKKYQLKVNVPPDLRDNGSTGNVSVVLNQPTNLVCDVTGSPAPVITWYKDGVPILQRGKTLRLLKAVTADAGLPPTIVGTGSPQDVSAVLNQEISLDCNVKGTPFPTIQWYKDRKLVFLGDPNIEVSNKGQTLKIKSARLGDQARYQCSVTNAAGKQTKDFNLSVYVPPTIKGGNVTSEVTALLDTVVMLECEARGVPLPTITWYRNGEAILSSHQAQYVDRGHFLRIPRAQASDTGQFSCRVTSVAGTAEKNFELDVYLPPSIEGGQDTATERKVVLTKPLTLECEARGHPPPTLTWLKDGVPVRNGESINILEQGRKIEILSTSVSDAGRYGGDEVTDTTVIINNLLELECRATGTPSPVFTWFKDGQPVRQGEGLRVTANGRRLVISRPQVSDTARFQFPPSIRSTGPSERSVVLHRPISLQCVPSGTPPPSITWLKDGRPVDTAQEHLKLESVGRTLHITEARLEDAGRYTCYPIQLECKATGSPVPAITWYKDGRPLTSAAGVTILKRGQLLEIDRAQLSDAGLYRCIAVNVAGTSKLSHRLQVYDRDAFGPINQPHVAASNQRDFETDGSPVASVSDGIQVLSGGRVLSLSSAQVSDTGKYTCVAVNAGGEQQREYDLRVYVPPNIMGEEVNATVMLGRSVELRCQSDAIPPPTLSWRKDGRPLFRKPGLTVSEDGSVLKIDSAQVQDSGRYTFSPSIRGSEDVSPMTVIEGSLITLVCESSGIPPPSLTWRKNGSELKSDSRVRALSGGRQLQISGAERTDSASYTCTASNAAGNAAKEYSLQVYVRPSIRRSEGPAGNDITVTRGGDITLQCEADGVPRPAVTWLKDGRPITGQRGAQVLNEGRLLQIKDAKVSDTGRYMCVVVNVAGQADGKHDASGIPLPAITWLKDGRPIRASSSVRVLSGGRSLRLMHAAVEDAGRYSCIVSNTAGEERKNFDLDILVPPSIVDEGTVQDAKVKEKHNVTLTCEVTVSPTIVGSGPEGSAEEVTVTLSSPMSLVCEVQSYPPALITWLKDGTPFESSRNVRVLPGGRTLQILNAQEEDAGRYTFPPQINKNDVPGEGLAPKEVKIKVNNTLTLESNGRIVRIKHAQVSDTGRYTCVATNIAGEDEKDFDVNIQVPPSFQRPGGVGDTTSTPGRGGDVKDVVLNNPISLYCETNAVPPPTLTWYTCVAVNEAGEDSIQYDVRVLLPPYIRGADRDLPEEVVIQVNKTTVLECQVDGSPTPKITWLKDSQPISPDGPHRLLSNGRSLQVVNAQVTDTGRYVCVADNLAGSAEKSFNLNVHGGRTLQILRAKMSDGGKYSCVAMNPAGEARKLLYLTVFGQYLQQDRTGQATLHTLLDFSLTPCVSFTYPPSFPCLPYTAPVHSITKTLLSPLPHPCLSPGSPPVPPSIKDSSGDSPVVVSVRVGNSVTLECESNAVPPPTITWYKNGRMVTESANLRILAEGQMLELKGAEVSDTGQYVCKATNVAGQVDKNFHLNIYVPPSIDGPAEENIVETISNPVTFACDAIGIPPPSLTWLKNGRTIENSESLELHILSGGSKLQIARSQLSDSGTYTCVAANVEGKARKSYHLTIQVPPSISDSEMPSEVGVLLNDSVQLVCHSQGTPPPSIQISPDGSTLTVSGAHTSDSGKYTCVATNKAGEEDRIFNLNVYVPPVIEGNRDTAVELTTVLDSSINIECVAVGSPPPQLNWLKNGLPLPVSSQIRLLSAGQVLRIARAQVSDGGTFTCVASNRAGVDNRHYNLQVHVPPSLDGAGSREDVTVVRGNLASLLCIADGTPSPSMSWLRDGEALVPGPHVKLLNLGTTVQIIQARVEDTGRYTCLLCEATGIPAPTLTWMKDGRPLPQTDGLRVLRGGEVLRISSPQVEDTGRYTCLANSPAGDDDKEFLVRVHVPPNIAGESTPQNVSVLQNRQVTLECKSDAVPPPILTWLKDGKPLQASPRVRVLSSARYLQINMAELGDGAQYICVASNIAGKTTRQFNLAVNVAPTIAEGPQTVAVHIDQPLVLECIVSGVPAPRVTWRKHGAILAGTNPRYRFAEDGSLHVHSAQVTDTGRYLCMATNQAGTQRKRVDLQVYVPPSIARGPTNITVTVNVQTTLSCEATGIPKPTVSWTKNGRTLNTDHNQNMLLSSGSLVVIAPTVEDTAEYEFPPSIVDEATELVVTRLSPLVIGCTASGVPEPILHWSKDGMKLPKEGKGYNILSSGPVEITSSELSHSGRYSCVAKNAAGSAHRHVQLTVQEVPVIQVHPSTMDVIVNNPITLPCRATGSPRPTITWQKEGINIPTTGGGFTVLPNGGLQISKAAVADSGTYMCVAQNPAGTALGKTKLRVQVPPVISSQTQSYLVPLDSSITLLCQAEGSPSPSVAWHKDGQPLSESVRQRVLSSGSLQIAFGQPGDTGRYTCTAANAAGTSSLEMSLTVQIPPSIRGGELEVSVVENSQAQMACVAEGVPQPTLSWEKEGTPLSDTSGEYTILPSGELVIDIAQPDDAGSYTCVATNTVGQDSRTVSLSVHTHPAFTEMLADVALNKGERLLLACGVTGIPPPKITWAFNNIIIPAHYDHVNGHSELVIERVTKVNSGTYSCVAENNVGTIKSLGSVYVKGDPLPTIQWSKKGVNIQISNRIRQLDNGSLAIYGTVRLHVYYIYIYNTAVQHYYGVHISSISYVYVHVGCVLVDGCEVNFSPEHLLFVLLIVLTVVVSPQNEDAGNYMCVATNDAGVVERIEPVETVVDAGTTVLLNCRAEGEPMPVIEWSRKGSPLLGNERFTTLSNGSLRLTSAQKEDTAEYECVARNLLGSVLVRVTLTVREWIEWGPCSASCGVGVQRRLRQCNNPLPANGGRHCTDSETETRSCHGKPCPVDGKWSEWSSWEECSRTCGQGNRTRVRTCTNPPVQHGGRPCEGKAVEAIMCSVRPCPVAGNWGAWLPWSSCSETCGNGMQTRVRLCNNPPSSFHGPPCEGPDTQTQLCKERHCPVDGKWSSWVSWGACSVSCGGGTRQRTRLCASPAPQHRGRQCEGNDVHIDFCNSDPCPVHGNWGLWSSWGSCSRTCNGGQMKRYRTCDNPRPANGGRALDGNWGAWQPWGECSASCAGGERTRDRLCNNPSPSDEGRPCPGDSNQLSRCNGQACPGGPQKARGGIIGNINDVEFGIAILNATISDNQPSYEEADLHPEPHLLDHSSGARGGGEILRMTHVARGLDSDGALLLDIVLNGHILQLPSNAAISVKDYTEDYIQTGPGQLYALSTRMFSIDRVSVPYSWNHTITYDPDKGKMPYLVETLHASAISAHYHPLEEVIVVTSVPMASGWTLQDPTVQDECKERNPCSHVCHNAMGTYYCSCPRGLTISADGRTCQDIDECSLGGHMCHDGEDCENTIGSYRCESNPCNQHCLNTIGSYRCACEPGYQLRNRRCIDIDECRDGTHQCRYNQICENRRGSYHCTCPRGYRSQGVGRPCV